MIAKLNSDNFQINNGQINLLDSEDTKNYSSFNNWSEGVQKFMKQEFNFQKSNNLTSSICIQNQYNQEVEFPRKKSQKSKKLKKKVSAKISQIKILSAIGHLQLMMKRKIMLCSSSTVYEKSKNYNKKGGNQKNDKDKQPYYQSIAKIVCQGRQKTPSDIQISHMSNYLKRKDQIQNNNFLSLSKSKQIKQVQTYKCLDLLQNKADDPRGKQVARRFNQKLQENNCWSLFFQKFVEDFQRRKRT